MQLKKLSDLITIAIEKNQKKKLVLASAEDDISLRAISVLNKLGLIDPILIGNPDEISRIIEKEKIELINYEICSATGEKESAKISVEYIKTGKAEILMKGLLSTRVFIKEMLNKYTGITTHGRYSHIGLFESPYYPKLFGVSDAAINIAPDLAAKKLIIINAVKSFHTLGVASPKVALLTAIEKINPNMQATVDAAELVEMNKREPFVRCTLEGPLALDVAISEVAAKHKGIRSEIAGKVDILIVPEITSGNVLYKSLTYLGGAKAAGVLIGTEVPVVLSSRSDSEESKIYSIALAHSICNF
jgi:phosphate butyryltransferase